MHSTHTGSPEESDSQRQEMDGGEGTWGATLTGTDFVRAGERVSELTVVMDAQRCANSKNR